MFAMQSNTPDSPSGSEFPEPLAKKRKSNSNSSRGVASLTPDQLAKKRANDREAQRAIRERTKAQIESLERRIQELSSQQPYQELQAALRQKDAIQAENDEIRRRLASIQAIIQPLVGAQGLTDLASAAQQNLQFGYGQSGNLFHQDQYQGQNGNRSMTEHSPHAIHAVSPEGSSMFVPPFANGEAMNSNDRMWQSSRHALDHQRSNLHRGLELNESERLSFNFLLDNNKRPQPQQERSERSSPGQQSVYPIGNTFSGQGQTSWTTLPKNVAPTCPLDGVLLKFLHSRQQEVSNANHQESSSGPSYPSVFSLLNPTARTHIDPLSQLMIEIISKFPAICSLPEQLATLYGMFILMRWMIYPTQDNYERIPEWLTPRPSQLFTPHPAWIDYLPWPRMRDKLVNNYQDYPFENWFIPFTTGLSVNWPYEPTDCLLSTSEKEESVINPVFERHLMRLENWSVGPSFVDAFPALADVVRVKHDLGMRSGDQLP